MVDLSIVYSYVMLCKRLPERKKIWFRPPAIADIPIPTTSRASALVERVNINRPESFLASAGFCDLGRGDGTRGDVQDGRASNEGMMRVLMDLNGS